MTSDSEPETEPIATLNTQSRPTTLTDLAIGAGNTAPAAEMMTLPITSALLTDNTPTAQLPNAASFSSGGMVNQMAALLSRVHVLETRASTHDNHLQVGG